MISYLALIVAPLFFAPFAFVRNELVRNILVIAFVLILAGLSLVNFISYEVPREIALFSSAHALFVFLDIVVLGYFLVQGLLFRHKLITYFAFAQILLYGVVLFLSPTLDAKDIYIDQTSVVMYLIINMVGGAIIVYSLEYIKSETFSQMKKSAFIAILFLFLSLMNFIVSTNNIEIFFLLFELTTLCSYLLIAYRKDEASLKNAQRALWMNQVGGVAILIALILSSSLYDTVHFSTLLQKVDGIYMLALVFLALGAFVKGASLPFEQWLLGAMAAPTPVSAILHSATMVKIAPFLILKLSPALSGSLSLGITLFGTFVFFSASLLALSKDYFKEILGLSTVALLGLMMALAAIATQEALLACLVLIVFHAISKALLFMQAGILEKSFHLKYVHEIDGLINHSKLAVFFIVIGFASLTLPPFGAFVGKFMAIESISKEILNNPLYVFALIFIALGSVFLTLLYFKVLTKLFAKDVDSVKEEVKISRLYTWPSYFLLGLLFVGMYVSVAREFLSVLEIVVPLVLIALVPLLFSLAFFSNAHRVKEYNCAEKDSVKLNMYYFYMPQQLITTLRIIAIVGIALLFVGALVW